MKAPYDSREAFLEDTAEKAHRFEKIYHGCGQSVVAALMENFPQIRNPEAFRAASGLAGGIGLSIEGSCGALAGGTMALGLAFGRKLDAFDDPEGKRFTAYRLAKRLYDRFAAEYGSCICREVQRKVMGRPYRLHDPEEFETFVQAGGHSRDCPRVAALAARWTAEILLEELEAAGKGLQFSASAE